MKNIDVVSLKVVKDKAIKANLEVEKISGPSDVHLILKDYIGDSDREHFVIIMLDTKNQINAIHTVSTGTLNSSLVHPREVFKVAILKNSASIILAHNHPSSSTIPSKEDVNITKRLVECGELLGIKILDHVIVSEDSYTSFKEMDLI